MVLLPSCSLDGAKGIRAQSVPLLLPARSGHCQAPTPKSASLSTTGLPQALHCCPVSLPPLPLHLGGHEALRQLREQSPGARAEICHLHPGRAPGTRGRKCCLLSLALFRCLCPSVLSTRDSSCSLVSCQKPWCPPGILRNSLPPDARA